MAYYFEKISYENGNWTAHLLIPSKTELNDSFEYMTGGLRRSQNLQLIIESAKEQTQSPDYCIVTSRHQIDNAGNLFVSPEWNIRQQPCQADTMAPATAARTALHQLAHHYATQYDYDKFCCNNPDDRFPFDWNAEVYKAFVSSAPGTYTPADQANSP